MRLGFPSVLSILATLLLLVCANLSAQALTVAGSDSIATDSILMESVPTVIVAPTPRPESSVQHPIYCLLSATVFSALAITLKSELRTNSTSRSTQCVTIATGGVP